MIKQSILAKYRPKKVNIKGKDYITVSERVKLFYKACEDQGVSGCILNDLVSDDGQRCTFKSTIWIDGQVLATGYASEDQDSSYINKTSYLENCETSAVGRALGFAGIGIDSDIASANEVISAQVKEEVIRSREISSQFRCEKCGKVIRGSGKRTAEQIISGTQRAFGKMLCIDCALEEKGSIAEPEEEKYVGEVKVNG